MDEDAADGSGASRVDWDALTPAVERVGSARSPGSSSDTDAGPSDSDPVEDDSVDRIAPVEDTDEDALAAAVTEAAEATGPQLDSSGQASAADGPGTAGERASTWDDLTPAVERVAPVPAVERVAPVPAVTRVEEDEDEDKTKLEQAIPGEDFTNPAADIGDTSDAAGGETTSTPTHQGPPDDAEQPLAVHIEEMVKRLGIVIAVAGAVSLALFPLTGEVINFLWYSILPGSEAAAPHVYHPLEYKLTQLKTASLGGLIIALPVFVYQTYRFMRPGLYPHERRYYLASVPTSLILGLLGVMFAYFIVLPAVMSYFLYYSQDVVTIAFALGATFDLILLLMGYLAVVFQIPLFVMLAIMMGLTTRQWLEDRRLIFWGGLPRHRVPVQPRPHRDGARPRRGDDDRPLRGDAPPAPLDGPVDDLENPRFPRPAQSVDGYSAENTSDTTSPSESPPASASPSAAGLTLPVR